MSSTTKIEQNAVNEVRDYIDVTDCLRSYVKDNDRTPLWDGTVFVYKGEPDIVFDNIHYTEQLDCYRQCLAADKSFTEVIRHDLQILERQMPLIKSGPKATTFSSFVEELKHIC